MNQRLSPRDRPEMIAEARHSQSRFGNAQIRDLTVRPVQVGLLVALPPGFAYSLYWMFRFTGREVPFWQLWLLLLAVGAALLLISLVGRAEEPAPPRSNVSRMPYKSPFAEANRWEDRFSWCDDDTERFNTVVRPRLAELITERLRLRQGIDLAADPQRARSVLPGPLYRLATGPVAAPPSTSEMDDIARLIETV